MSLLDPFWRYLAAKLKPALEEDRQPSRLFEAAPPIPPAATARPPVVAPDPVAAAAPDLPAPPEREAATVPESDAPTPERLRELMGLALSLPTPDAVMAFVDFTHRMRRLGPYNMMMVYTQRPGATQVASRDEWARAGQTVRPDSIPILILRPKGPISQVFELLDTVPEQPRDPSLDNFGASGDFDARRLASLKNALMKSAKRELRVEVVEEDYGAALAGQISRFGLFHPSAVDAPMMEAGRPGQTIDRRPGLFTHWRVKLNRRLTPVEQYATLLHELGHLFCGHLGRFDADNPAADEYGWPDRSDLPHATREIEAELVAWHMCDREGLVTGAPLYLKPHLEAADNAVAKVDLDRVIRAIARIRAYAGDAKIAATPIATR